MDTLHLLISFCSDIRSSLKQQLSSLLLIPQDLGITKYLDIDTNNLSRGALQALPKLLQRLPKGPPDDNLVRAFKEPFDNELTSRTPRLSRQAQSAIHNYIGVSETCCRHERG